MVEVMKKESVNYGVNKKVAEKMLGRGVVVLDLTESGKMHYLSPGKVWKGLVIPEYGKKVLSMCMAYEGMKEFERKKGDESFFMEVKNVGKKRGAKSYGRLVGFGCDGELMDVDRGEEFFRRWYEDEVMKRWGNVIGNLGKLEKDVVLLYEEEDNRFGYVDVLKRIIEGAA